MTACKTLSSLAFVSADPHAVHPAVVALRPCPTRTGWCEIIFHCQVGAGCRCGLFRLDTTTHSSARRIGSRRSWFPHLCLSCLRFLCGRIVHEQMIIDVSRETISGPPERPRIRQILLGEKRKQDVSRETSVRRLRSAPLSFIQ